jgi:hypothetical protein
LYVAEPLNYIKVVFAICMHVLDLNLHRILLFCRSGFTNVEGCVSHYSVSSVSSINGIIANLSMHARAI